MPRRGAALRSAALALLAAVVAPATAWKVPPWAVSPWPTVIEMAPPAPPVAMPVLMATEPLALALDACVTGHGVSQERTHF